MLRLQNAQFTVVLAGSDEEAQRNNHAWAAFACLQLILYVSLVVCCCTFMVFIWLFTVCMLFVFFIIISTGLNTISGCFCSTVRNDVLWRGEQWLRRRRRRRRCACVRVWVWRSVWLKIEVKVTCNCTGRRGTGQERNRNQYGLQVLEFYEKRI